MLPNKSGGDSNAWCLLQREAWMLTASRCLASSCSLTAGPCLTVSTCYFLCPGPCPLCLRGAPHCPHGFCRGPLRTLSSKPVPAGYCCGFHLEHKRFPSLGCRQLSRNVPVASPSLSTALLGALRPTWSTTRHQFLLCVWPVAGDPLTWPVQYMGLSSP